MEDDDSIEDKGIIIGQPGGLIKLTRSSKGKAYFQVVVSDREPDKAKEKAIGIYEELNKAYPFTVSAIDEIKELKAQAEVRKLKVRGF